MTIRLSIDDQSDQDPSPVHGAEEAGGGAWGGHADNPGRTALMVQTYSCRGAVEFR
jgi:hypothetical protein